MLDIEEFAKSGELFDGHYKLLYPLSTDGGTADVWLAIDTNTIDTSLDFGEDSSANNAESGMLIAIKIYRPKNALDVEGEQRFRDEYKIVYECRHANLLQPTGFSIFHSTPYLVLPFCKYGSSEKLIGKKISNQEIWKYISDVASGLDRLHTNDPQIIHQDIKPANVLIDNSKNYAITDFGISSKRDGEHAMYHDEENSGTLAYMAPERFQEGGTPMASSDIWAFGATLCEILTGKVPFGENGGKGQAEQSMQLPLIPNVSSDIQRLIHACLALDPEKRPTAEKLKAAAAAQQYPLKSRGWLYAVCGIVATIVIAVVIILSLGKKEKEGYDARKTEPVVSQHELYMSALGYMNSSDVDTLRQGVSIMENLSAQNYIPAIYELAFTYGWYNDSVSVNRKRMLGIEIFDNGNSRFLPKSDKVNNDAFMLFQRILSLNDSTYADENALAALMIARYYLVENKTFLVKKAEGEKYLQISQGWARFSGNIDILNRIDAFFKYNNN